MKKRNTKKRVKNTRKAYSYTPDSSLNDAEKRVYRSMIFSFILIFAIAIGLYVWGTDIIFSINNFWRTYFPSTENITDVNEESLILSPRIDPLPLYTNESKVDVSGWAQSGDEVAIYLNEEEIVKILVDTNGRYVYTGLILTEGTNVIYTKTVDQDRYSDPSETVTIELDTIKPDLTYTLGDIDTVNQEIVISGRSVDANTLYINDNRVILQNGGEFTHTVSLQPGDNSILLLAEDLAGNTTHKEEKVTLPVEEEETSLDTQKE